MLIIGSERDWIAIRALLPLSDSGTADQGRRILPNEPIHVITNDSPQLGQRKAIENELHGVLTISKPVTMASCREPGTLALLEWREER
jgi:hypothetical protein